MPFTIIRNDITNMSVDAIVSTANPIMGSGTDHKKAGSVLLTSRQKIGSIPQGGAAIAPASDLSVKYVIHTAVPVWIDGTHDEEKLLRSCYDAALKLAQKHRCHSIAFPLISTEHYGFPKDKALQIAIGAFRDFLLKKEMQIYLVVFHREAYTLSEKLFHSVSNYIDEHFVDTCKAAKERLARSVEFRQSTAFAAPAPCQSKALSLEDMLKQADAGFTETLLKLIDKTGKKDSEIYKKALLCKQHFSKIRNNPNYKPTKQTAISLALALELNLEETKDLIGRAGYALTNSSKFDLIIRYFIENRNYNVVEINCVLFEHDQSLLG